jgi:7-carboxy-7-deazaguanine synthase
VAHLSPAVIRIVDIKTPGSGEVERNFWDALHGLRPQDAIKFVLCDEADYFWSAEVVRSRSLSGRAEILFSPVAGKLDPRDLAAWILRDHLPVRLNLQLHKYVWGAETRGV